MKDGGYSTIVDAIIFLVMVSACALILGSAIQGGERLRAVSDSSLRAKASSTLASMERVKIDYFEYRVLGDKADALAEKCGIDPGAWLFRDTAKAVLGRGNRHKAVMEIAAEAAACQFDLRYGDDVLRLNLLTGDYRDRARATVDGYLRERLDSRYAYRFSLRWVPFADVPFEGSVSCGGPAPPGAASVSTYVTLPYRTSLTKERVEEAIAPDLADIEGATAEYMAGGPEVVFRERVRASLGRCLVNASRPMVGEVLGNTLYEALPANDVGNPLSMLAAFSDDYRITADPLLADTSFDVEDQLCSMIVLYNGESLDRLADEVVDGIKEGTMGPGDEEALIIRWMSSRYNPSRARATLSVWVRADA
jgi:hypothetical protein